MFSLKRIRNKKKIKELLKNLSEKDFIYKNGKFIKEENDKPVIIDLTTLSDEELISILKKYDSMILNQKNQSIILERAEEVKKILFNRVIKTIKTAQLIRYMNNKYTINMSYEELLEINSKLQFYIMNIIYDEKLLKLANEINLILESYDDLNLVKKDKKYEKTRLSI